MNDYAIVKHCKIEGLAFVLAQLDGQGSGLECGLLPSGAG